MRQMLSLHEHIGWVGVWCLFWFSLNSVLAIIALTRIVHTPHVTISKAFTILAVSILLTCLWRILGLSVSIDYDATDDTPLLSQDHPSTAVFAWILPKVAPCFQQIAVLMVLYIWQDTLLVAGAVGAQTVAILRAALVSTGLQVVILLVTLLVALWDSPEDASAVFSGLSALVFLVLFVSVVAFAVKLHELFLRMAMKKGRNRSMAVRVLQLCSPCRVGISREPLREVATQEYQMPMLRVSVLAMIFAVSATLRVISACADAWIAGTYAAPIKIDGSGPDTYMWAAYYYFAEILPYTSILIFTLNEPWRSYVLCEPCWRKCRLCGAQDDVFGSAGASQTGTCGKCCWGASRGEQDSVVDPSVLLLQDNSMDSSVTQVSAPRAIDRAAATRREASFGDGEEDMDGDLEVNIQAPSSSYLASSFMSSRGQLGLMSIPASPGPIHIHRSILMAEVKPSSYTSNSFASHAHHMLSMNSSPKFSPQTPEDLRLEAWR